MRTHKGLKISSIHKTLAGEFAVAPGITIKDVDLGDMIEYKGGVLRIVGIDNLPDTAAEPGLLLLVERE